MNEITTKRDPAILALEIRTLQQQAESILTSYIIEIGRRLCEAKAVLDHGQWGSWLKEQVQFSQSTAQNYMKIYERFGSDQVSLFGETKSETIGNLPYTKALKLLAIPEDEVDEFIAENNVEDMSTRELAKAIKERDEAKAEAKKLADTTAESHNAYVKAKMDADAAKKEADALRAELVELKSRPVEVAVEAPSQEMLDQIRAEEARKAAVATVELEKKLAKAEAKAQKEAEKAKKLKDKADKAGEEVKAELQKDLDAATAAKNEAEAAKVDAEARAKALEDKLKTANGDVAVFKVYFAGVQEDLNRMLGIIRKADQADKAKYKAALLALLDSVGGMLE